MDKRIIIMISEDHIKDLDAIAQKLVMKGLNLTAKHDYGVITGSTAESNVKQFLKLPGVQEVMPDLEAGINPPSEPPE